MISTTHHCHICKSTNLVKYGTDRKGSPKYKCKDCKTVRVLEYKPKYTEEKKEEIMNTYFERSSLRGLHRIFGVNPDTVSKWLKKKPKK
jgi:transposase-like protein